MNSYPKRSQPPKRTTLHLLFHFCHFCDISKEVMEMVSSHATLPSCSPANYSISSLFPFSKAWCPLVSLFPLYHLTHPLKSFISLLLLGVLLICLLSVPQLVLRCVLAAVFHHSLASLICSTRSYPALLVCLSLPASSCASNRVLYGLCCVPLQLFLLPCIPFCPIILLPVTSYFLVTSSAFPSPDFLTFILSDLSPALPSSPCHVPPFAPLPLLSPSVCCILFLLVPSCPRSSSPSCPLPLAPLSAVLPYLLILVSSSLSGISCP